MTTAAPQTGAPRPWDRTRWDRLQACLLLALFAGVPALIPALILSALGGAL